MHGKWFAFIEMNSSVTDSNANNFSNVSGHLDFESDENDFEVMMILQSVIASVGVLVNLLVVVVFLNHKTLRCKIPNIFIINQVSTKYNISSKCDIPSWHSSVGRVSAWSHTVRQWQHDRSWF